MNARSFTFACLLALVISVPQLQAQTVIGSDDFDGGEIFLTRTFDPDLSGNAIPGTWTSNFDVFGIVDRSVNFRFADDTLLDPTLTEFSQARKLICFSEPWIRLTMKTQPVREY